MGVNFLFVFEIMAEDDIDLDDIDLDDDDIYAGLSRTEIAELKRKEEEWLQEQLLLEQEEEALLMQADLKEKNKARIEEIRIERQKREEEEWRRQQEEEERVAKIRAE